MYDLEVSYYLLSVCSGYWIWGQVEMGHTRKALKRDALCLTKLEPGPVQGGLIPDSVRARGQESLKQVSSGIKL